MSRGRCGRKIAPLRRLAARGRCELPAILRVTPTKSLAASDFFAAGDAKNPSDFCSGMVASPLAATVVTAILRCDFCAAKAPKEQRRRHSPGRHPKECS